MATVEKKILNKLNLNAYGTFKYKHLVQSSREYPEMQFQIWDSLYEIGLINTGEKTYQNILIIFLHSLYMSQLFKQCVSASNLPFHMLLGYAGAETLKSCFSLCQLVPVRFCQ